MLLDDFAVHKSFSSFIHFTAIKCRNVSYRKWFIMVFTHLFWTKSTPKTRQTTFKHTHTQIFRKDLIRKSESFFMGALPHWCIHIGLSKSEKCDLPEFTSRFTCYFTILTQIVSSNFIWFVQIKKQDTQSMKNGCEREKGEFSEFWKYVPINLPMVVESNQVWILWRISCVGDF